MDADDLADELLAACINEANALLLLATVDMASASAFIADHRDLVDAAIYAGITGAIFALQNEGYVK